MSDPNDVFSKVFAEHGEMLENCEEIIILGTSATTEKRQGLAVSSFCYEGLKFCQNLKRNQLQKKYPNSSALVSVRNGQNDNSEPSVEQLSDTGKAFTKIFYFFYLFFQFCETSKSRCC